MNFSNIRGLYGRTNNTRASYSEGKSIYSRSSKPVQESKQESSLISSILKKNDPISYGIGLRVDKGTAANTTVHIDKESFNQIMDYTTRNTAYKWDEIGCDGAKKWVVVDGQRFEYSLSKEEREAFKKRWKVDNSSDSKVDTEKEKDKNDSIKKEVISISLDKDNKVKFDNAEKAQANPKLANLMKNSKVMRMLSDIMKTNKHRSINLNLD